MKKTLPAALLISLPILAQAQTDNAAMSVSPRAQEFQSKWSSPNAMAASLVPFIGCPGNGAFGTTSPDIGRPVNVPLPRNVKSRLAIYSGAGLAILAPRGWHCTSFIGMSGGTLSILKYPKNQSGPSVIVSFGAEDGAAYSNYFTKIFSPDKRLQEKYATDDLDNVAPDIIRYFTPPYHYGLGTDAIYPQPNKADLPILPTYGLIAVTVNRTPDIGSYYLSVRLPSQIQDLQEVIVGAFAKCMKGNYSISCQSMNGFIQSGATTRNNQN